MADSGKGGGAPKTYIRPRNCGFVSSNKSSVHEQSEQYGRYRVNDSFRVRQRWVDVRLTGLDVGGILRRLTGFVPALTGTQTGEVMEGAAVSV